LQGCWRFASNPTRSTPDPTAASITALTWDEVAVYRQDVQWDDQVPRAVFLDGPVVHALGFANVVTELLSRTTKAEPRKEESQALSAP